MFLKKYCLIVMMILILGACSASGPEKALDKLATALEKNDNAAFLAGIDMAAFTDNYLRDLTSSDEALSSLNALGNMLGLGSLDQLINSVVDMRERLRQQFERGVASGELMARCRTTDKPDCPWVPQSLRDATVVEIDANAAIAKVTTPTRLTSWLALRKFGNDWKVVGMAILESAARSMAQKAAGTAPASGQPARSAVKI